MGIWFLVFLAGGTTFGLMQFIGLGGDEEERYFNETLADIVVNPHISLTQEQFERLSRAYVALPNISRRRWREQAQKTVGVQNRLANAWANAESGGRGTIGVKHTGWSHYQAGAKN